jgi:erythromycin esterase
MQTKLSFLFLVFLFIAVSCKEEIVNESIVDETPIDLTANEKEIVKELNSFVTPLKGTSPELDNSDINILNQFGSATVIGLGEATHGTKEFFQMKHRLFKYFVEQHGFRIFGFEADMGECIYIDRFITKGIGTVQQAMAKMHFWTWKTEEVKDLIIWMKNYNSGKSESNQIHLLGVDCQFVTFNQLLIEDYLNNNGVSIPSNVKMILNEVTNIGKQAEITINTKNTLKEKCDTVKMFFETNKSVLISKSGQFEYDIIFRLTEQARQYLDVLVETSFNYRDQYMAENTVWLTTLLGNKTKVVSWAHNGHLAKDSRYGTGSQGYYLSQNLGVDYKVIGFSFNIGSFQAVNYNSSTGQYTGLIEHTIDQLPLRDSYNYVFHAVNPKDFMLVSSAIPDFLQLYSWYNSERKFMSIGAVYNIGSYSNYYYLYNLMNVFDAIIHIQKTTKAVAFKG